MTRSNSQRGYILLPVVLLIALVATSAFLLNNESALDTGITSSTLEAKQAEQVAKAGLQHALWQVGQQGCGPYTDLTTRPLDNHSYTTTLTTNLGSTTSYTIAADQDTWIRSDQPTVNYASDTKLHIRFETGIIERPLYRYDLSPIAAGSNILSATAWFYVSKEHPEGPVDIHLLNADWIDTDATWDTMGDKMDQVVQASIPAQPVAGVWVAVNLTSQVQAWVNGRPNFGITLNSTSEGTHGDYASNEAAQQPYVEVIVGTPVSSADKLRSKATLASGISRTINLKKLGLYQHPPSLRRYQPDATAAVDAYIWEFSKNSNYGTDDEAWVATGSNNKAAALFKFGMDIIPAGARIEAATLSVFHRDGYDSNVPVTAHRITSGWSEDGVSWNKRDSSNDWNSAGGDYDSAVVSTTSVGPASSQSYQWDITSLVQGWSSGAFPNHGVILRTDQPGIFGERFDTSDHTDPGRHPRLEITYSCECGSPCLAPQGSGNVLMVVINPTTLVPMDAYKKALFESWGYSVAVVGESSNQDTYDSAIAASDVVFISETVNASQVGTKLQGVDIAVVSQDGIYNDDLGIATGNAFAVASAINLTDTSHYITSVFPPGPLDIFNGTMEQLTVSGSTGPDLQTLADTAGAGSLVVLDKGAIGSGGTPLSGRRVMLPFGRDANFNWDYLNANGRLLLHRALQWGMGADLATLPAKNLLFVSGGSLVIEQPSGDTLIAPTAQEQLRIDLIESWGYTVTLIHHTQSQADFDAALSGKIVAYVSSDVTETGLGTKLVNAAIGVVNEQAALVDEFGFGFESVNYKSRNQIDVIDNTDYITEPFPTGLLTIVLADQQLHFMTATEAAGFTALARVFNTGSLWDDAMGVIEAGGALYGGGNAAGRRVLLPWGDASFDVSALNADGQTIMKRAIEWAATAPSSKAPVAHWKLDETTGITAVDSAGGHDGTLVDSPAWVGGRVDGALSLDGNSDYINVPHDDNLSLSSFSISAWIRASALSGWQVIVNKGTTTSAVNYYLATNNAEIGLGFYNAGWIEFNTTTANLTTNRWYHVAATYDDSTRQGKIYLDGTPIHDSTVAASPLPNSDALTIGRSGFGEHWAGMLDDVRIYNQVLTDSDVSELAVGPERLPIAHWKLDEASGLTAVDSVGGHDGVLANGPVWTGGALLFDAIDDYVDLTSDAELDDIFVGGGTAMAWINPAGWGEADSGRIFDKSSSASSTGDGWAIRINGEEDTIQFGHGFSGGRGWWRSPPDAILLGTWQHVAIAYDASSTANDPSIYINGSPVNVTRVDAPSGDALSDAAINLRLGNYAGGATHTFDGKIDDARIYNVTLDAPEVAALAADGGGGVGPGGCNGTYRDDFDSVSWSGSNGTLDWSATPWAEVGESDGAGSGDVMVMDDLSNSRLRIRDNDNGGEGVERVADLDGAATATLSLDYRRDALDNTNDYVAVYLSTNGTAGPWDEIARFQGGDNDTAYQSFSQDISAYISAQTAIRLLSSSNMGRTDTVWFDNIQIECTP